MGSNLHAFCRKRVLEHDREVLQDHAPGQVGKLGLENGTLASNSSAHVNEDGRIFRDIGVVCAVAFDESLEVDHVQPSRLSAERSHPKTKVGDEVRTVLVCPLKCRTVCVVDDLQWSVDDVVRVLEFGLPEEVGSFGDGRSNDMKSWTGISDPYHQQSEIYLKFVSTYV